jgi:hypothetical protein
MDEVRRVVHKVILTDSKCLFDGSPSKLSIIAGYPFQTRPRSGHRRQRASRSELLNVIDADMQ